MQRVNGLRIFHGAAVALMLGSAWLGSARAESLADHANRGLVELVTGGDAASIAMAQDLASVIDDGETRRLLPVIGRGAIENLVDVKLLHGIDLGVVQLDALESARDTTMPHLDGSITYVAKLHNEELHILAPAETKQLADLAGKNVELVGGAKITAAAAFDLLHIRIQPVFDEEAVALAKLKSGDVAAMAYVAAKPSLPRELQRDAGGLHFVPVPFNQAMASRYVPAQLTSDDYPDLVGGSAGVDTIAVGMVLVAANLTPKTERYQNVANFVDTFFTDLPRLQEQTHHPKWREVNVAADLQGWRRFPPADAWLKRNVVAAAPPVDQQELRDIFARFLDERAKAAGSQTLTAEQKDQLFDQFQRWQHGKPH
ncbi:MAG TPA: TRAP transporter substrate-binding protein [Stellaceae bacterium]|nr:TRAP transporter substrate-binding protein [Stellaceae bacterium]